MSPADIEVAENAHGAYVAASAEVGKLESARDMLVGEISDDADKASPVGPKAGEDGSWLAAALQNARSRPGFALAGGER
jgi:hypothetical protein